MGSRVRRINQGVLGDTVIPLQPALPFQLMAGVQKAMGRGMNDWLPSLMPETIVWEVDGRVVVAERDGRWREGEGRYSIWIQLRVPIKAVRWIEGEMLPGLEKIKVREGLGQRHVMVRGYRGVSLGEIVKVTGWAPEVVKACIRCYQVPAEERWGKHVAEVARERRERQRWRRQQRVKHKPIKRRRVKR